MQPPIPDAAKCCGSCRFWLPGLIDFITGEAEPAEGTCGQPNGPRAGEDVPESWGCALWQADARIVDEYRQQEEADV